MSVVIKRLILNPHLHRNKSGREQKKFTSLDLLSLFPSQLDFVGTGFCGGSLGAPDRYLFSL